jgi:hypothetical protein
VVQSVRHLSADGSVECLAQRQVHVGPNDEVSRGHCRGDSKTSETDSVRVHVAYRIEIHSGMPPTEEFGTSCQERRRSKMVM